MSMSWNMNSAHGLARKTVTLQKEDSSFDRAVIPGASNPSSFVISICIYSDNSPIFYEWKQDFPMHSFIKFFCAVSG
jgi:hypothetical protein